MADVTWIRDLRIFSKSFDEFVTKKYKIVFVLQKKVKEEKYKNILVEVKKGLFKKIYNEFPEKNKDLIDYQNDR